MPLVAVATPYTPVPEVLTLSPNTPRAMPLGAVFVTWKTAPGTFALPENGSVKPPTSSVAGAHALPFHFST
jgi:hypothetical protein